MEETIHNYEELMQMLDSCLREPTHFWNEFYSDRVKKVPFFKNAPDENLVSYVEDGIVPKGKVLELGCGPGRNAIYLAENGWEVDAIDLAETTLKWARERAEAHDVNINFIQKDIFDLTIEEGVYDFVYDSGCFHHIAPHRRMCYINVVRRALPPGGFFALTCFVEGGKLGGADLSDWEVYKEKSLRGGLGFTEDKLKKIFHEFQPIEIRRMNEAEPSSPVFGVPDLWTALFRR
ncbi:bifunctional 2-polyprenyl-6-hydroxyphenol methylase/3-demethylubiquinol 3-O-methyltransferase UbiG [Halobacillus sp. BBL2006]|uniref:class I SAM-dependent methyltransferase n=1 Tax=Halobacillus sp. BBL2006 TaxID=1543706 RepID=UPI000541FBE5|nr:class I SAM-dependent methyltransferase [Halobacillus sp. BBL2006]KHE73242.1 methyltransferase [Halobacillus sp. BBL2006]